MALTNVSTVAGGVGKTVGDAVIAFNHVNVMFPLVTVGQSAKGSNSVRSHQHQELQQFRNT